MIPIQELKRHTIYLGYKNSKFLDRYCIFNKGLIFFKYMGKDTNGFAMIKRFGYVETNQGNFAIREDYHELCGNMDASLYEIFEISFSDYAVHVVREII